jgi:hypothetical protein
MFATSHPPHNTFLLTISILAVASPWTRFNMADRATDITDGKIFDTLYARLVPTFQFESRITYLTADRATHFWGAI